MRERQVTLPDLGARAAYGWGLGLALFDYDGVPVVGHDGTTMGQRACWRVLPGAGVVVAIATNSGDGPAMTDEVLDAAGGVLVGVATEEGVHPLITFLQDGRYLYNMRAVPRA